MNNKKANFYIVVGILVYTLSFFILIDMIIKNNVYFPIATVGMLFGLYVYVFGIKRKWSCTTSIHRC